MNSFLKRLLGSPSDTSDNSPVEDGGFTRNVLMKGVPGMETDSPSFTGKDGVAWSPDIGAHSPEGMDPAPISNTKDSLPPSPLSPDTQSLMPAANALPPEPPQAQAVQEFKKQSAPATVNEPPKPSIPAVVAPSTQEAITPKEPSALDKLLEAYNTPQKDTELETAQNRRNDIMRQLAALKGFEQIGAGLGGYTSKKDYLDDQEALAGQPVKDLEQRREQERKMKAEKGEGLKLGMDVERFKADSEAKGIDLAKAKLQLKDAQANKDPNSDISKAMREAIMKRFQIAGARVNVPAGLNADQLRSMYPMSDIVDDLLKQQSAKELAAARREMDQDKKETKAKEVADKRFSAANKLISGEVARANTPLGKMAGIHRSAEAIETLISQIPDPNNLDSRQITEIARNLDAMLSSGSATISGMQKLIPNTAGADLAHIQEYIGGIPKGARQGEFVKRMLETVHREKELASNQMKKAAKKLLSTETDLQQQDPIKWRQMLTESGLPEDLSYEPQPHDVATGAAAELARRKQGK